MYPATPVIESRKAIRRPLSDWEDPASGGQQLRQVGSTPASTPPAGEPG